MLFAASSSSFAEPFFCAQDKTEGCWLFTDFLLLLLLTLSCLILAFFLDFFDLTDLTL